MITNASVTIFTRIRDNDGDTWFREFVPHVWHHSGIKYTTTTDGQKAGSNTTNVHTVRIPDLSVFVSAGDYVVIGEGPERMETVKDRVGYEFCLVSGANYNRTGMNKHIKVVGA